MSTEEEGFIWISFCCFEPPYDIFGLVRKAVDWWCELNFDRRQRIHVKECRLVGWHSDKMFAISAREHDLFCQVVQQVWCNLKTAGVTDIPTLVDFSYMAEKGQCKTNLERDLIRKVVKVECNVTLLGAFLRCSRFEPIKHLAYPLVECGCDGDAVLF